MKVEILQKTDEDALKRFLKTRSAFNPYRRYKLLTQMQKDNFIQDELFLIAKKKSNFVITVKEGKCIRGIAALHVLIWDSRHFGMRMASLDRFFGDSAEVLDRLLGTIMRECARKKLHHLSCKIDQPDFCSINCLEEAGFKLMDTKLTYVFYGQKQRILPLKEFFPIREFHRGDLKPLIDIVKERFWINRFYNDNSFDKNKVVSFYVEWLKNCCRGNRADMVLVAEKAGIPVGFFTFLRNDSLLKAGIQCWGRGIAAVSAAAPGAYISLLKEALRRGRSYGIDIGEFDTQISNFPVIRLYQRFGMEFVNSSFWFHKALNI